MERDYFLTAQEADEYGIIDQCDRASLRNLALT